MPDLRPEAISHLHCQYIWSTRLHCCWQACKGGAVGKYLYHKWSKFQRWWQASSGEKTTRLHRILSNCTHNYHFWCVHILFYSLLTPLTGGLQSQCRDWTNLQSRIQQQNQNSLDTWEDPQQTKRNSFFQASPGTSNEVLCTAVWCIVSNSQGFLWGSPHPAGISSTLDNSGKGVSPDPGHEAASSIEVSPILCAVGGTTPPPRPAAVPTSKKRCVAPGQPVCEARCHQPHVPTLACRLDCKEPNPDACACGWWLNRTGLRVG